MLFRFSKQINNNDFYFRTDVRFFVSKKHFLVNLLNFYLERNYFGYVYLESKILYFFTMLILCQKDTIVQDSSL